VLLSIWSRGELPTASAAVRPEGYTDSRFDWAIPGAPSLLLRVARKCRFLPSLRFEVELTSDATAHPLDNDCRWTNAPAVEAVRCPDCGAPIVCVHTVPKLGDIPEIRSYRCVECGHVETGSVTRSRDDLHAKGAIL
jgi:hypothetical protein